MRAALAESFDYQVFGLRIRSEIPLPELFPAIGEAVPDVTIRRGIVPPSGPSVGLQTQGAALILTVPEVGRYRIEAGREIVVDPEPDAPEPNFRLFLLGSAFGAVLHQRGLLPLHANAVEIDGRAVAFMGESGAGKSTLAAWFHDHGHRVIADDVCVVGFKGAQAIAVPGLPRLRLWSDALRAMGRDSRDYPRSYGGQEQIDKFDVPIERTIAVCEPQPLAAIYLLDGIEPFAFTRLTGIEAAEMLFAHTYRGSYLAAALTHRTHWTSCITLAGGTPMFQLSRVRDFDRLDEQCAGILAHVARIAENVEPCLTGGS
jgi:hypothetical protein